MPGTLEVTEDRQYRERGLIHISDEAFACFKIIEEMRVQHMNSSRLMSSNEKAHFADNAIQAIKDDTALKAAWTAAFKDVEANKVVCKKIIQIG